MKIKIHSKFILMGMLLVLLCIPTLIRLPAENTTSSQRIKAIGGIKAPVMTPKSSWGTTPSPPIVLTSRSDWQLYASSGSGTQYDPYIISGYYIDCAGSGSGITIMDGYSGIYGVIENCYINNSGNGQLDAGVMIDASFDVELYNDCINNSGTFGIAIASSAEITVEGCLVNSSAAGAASAFVITGSNFVMIDHTDVLDYYGVSVGGVSSAYGVNDFVTFSNCNFWSNLIYTGFIGSGDLISGGGSIKPPVGGGGLGGIKPIRSPLLGRDYPENQQYNAVNAFNNQPDSSNVNYIACNFTNWYCGFYTLGSTLGYNSSIERCIFKGIFGNVVDIHCVQNMVFLDNIFKDTTPLTGYLIDLEGCLNVTFKGNQIINPWSCPLGLIFVMDAQEVMIDGNIVHYTNDTVVPIFDLTGDISNVTAVNNMIYGNGDPYMVALSLQVTETTPSNLICEDNTFIAISGILVGCNGGMYTVIKNNTFLGTGTQIGVSLSSDNATIEGNVFSNIAEAIAGNIAQNNVTVCWNKFTNIHTYVDGLNYSNAHWNQNAYRNYFTLNPYAIIGVNGSLNVPVAITNSTGDTVLKDYNPWYYANWWNRTDTITWAIYSSIDGLGIDMDWFKVIVDGNPVYDHSVQITHVLYQLQVLDYANRSYYNQMFNVNQTKYVYISVPITTIVVKNDLNISVLFKLTSGGITTVFPLVPDEVFDIRAVVGKYSWQVFTIDGAVIHDNAGLVIKATITVDGPTPVRIWDGPNSFWNNTAPLGSYTFSWADQAMNMLWIGLCVGLPVCIILSVRKSQSVKKRPDLKKSQWQSGVQWNSPQNGEKAYFQQSGVKLNAFTPQGQFDWRAYLSSLPRR